MGGSGRSPSLLRRSSRGPGRGRALGSPAAPRPSSPAPPSGSGNPVRDRRRWVRRPHKRPDACRRNRARRPAGRGGRQQARGRGDGSQAPQPDRSNVAADQAATSAGGTGRGARARLEPARPVAPAPVAAPPLRPRSPNPSQTRSLGRNPSPLPPRSTPCPHLAAPEADPEPLVRARLAMIAAVGGLALAGAPKALADPIPVAPAEDAAFTVRVGQITFQATVDAITPLFWPDGLPRLLDQRPKRSAPGPRRLLRWFRCQRPLSRESLTLTRTGPTGRALLLAGGLPAAAPWPTRIASARSDR